MGLIRLEDDQLVRVQEIDAQHQGMVDLINQLHKAMMRGSDRAALSDIIGDLIAHTRTHFRYEEQLMLQGGYPGYVKHKQQHDVLLRHITDLDERYRNGDLLLSFAVMIDLKGWALSHIAKYDVALGAYLNRAPRIQRLGDSPSRSASP
jgi:hemerythrin